MGTDIFFLEAKNFTVKLRLICTVPLGKYVCLVKKRRRRKKKIYDFWQNPLYNFNRRL